MYFTMYIEHYLCKHARFVFYRYDDHVNAGKYILHNESVDLRMNYLINKRADGQPLGLGSGDLPRHLPGAL